MDRALLSKLTKDFLNHDPSHLSGRDRYRLGWGGSLLASHPEASLDEKVSLLLELRERFAQIFEKPLVQALPHPRLPQPLDLPPGTFRPAWYFFRGALERDKRKNPEPIFSLLTETNEMAKARPVPGNSMLLRSLCRGKGILKQNNQGMIYLDVDNQFISMLLPFLKRQGLSRPPYFNLFDAPNGAHIPVIPAREVAFHYLTEIDLKRECSFEIEGLYSMEPCLWPEVEQVWFFKLRSDDLETFRRSYFLPSLPSGHSFHIAVAIKPRVTATSALLPMPVMRINPAISAA